MADSTGTYWTRILTKRLRRRRALAVTGGTAAGLLLAACGGSDSSEEGQGQASRDASGLLTELTDETKSAQRGGTLKSFLAFDQQSFDPMFTSLPNQVFTNMVYGQFWHYPGGRLQSSDGSLDGDLAESWEFSPDRLEMTIKLNPKARFGTTPTVPGANGRTPDAQDVLFSWERFANQGTRRSDIATSVNPDAPVLSMSAPDSRTIKIKLSQPYGIFMHLMANTQAGNMFILPKEAADDNVLDVRRTQLGTGPFQLDRYEPSVSYTHKRNPGFEQDRRDLGQLPYIDQIDSPIVAEYAAQLAQFKAGNIYSMGVRSEDILPTKRELPQLDLMTDERGALASTAGVRYFFGMLPESPFKDERVRQAWSMSTDRDLFINVVYNTDTFSKEGLAMEQWWDSALPHNVWTGWWQDPKGQDWAKFYKHDITEAKKLLTAAGYADGVQTNVRYPATGYPNTYYLYIDTILAMVPDAGFRTQIHTVNFGTEWRPQLADARGQFEGVSFILDSGGAEPANYLYLHYHIKGSLNHGYDPDGLNRREGDPTLNDLTTKGRLEFDEKKRMELASEIQKYEAKKVYFPRVAGGATAFSLAWPALRGRGVWQGTTSRGFGTSSATNWLDPTKAPIKQT
jgi:peptide/nickel transport system substrate-binding protein